MRILAVEDSERLRRALTTGLRKAGYAVDATGDGEEGLWFAQNNEYDVIVLDLMLPGMDGLTILDRLRREGKNTQILILTARDTVEDRVRGLEMGADDYLTKPFAFEELLARVHALIRRNYESKNPLLRVADIEVNTLTKRATRAGEEIALTPREFSLLEYLLMRRGELVTRSEIEAHIYDDRANPMSNVVDAAICTLRRKICPRGEPDPIRTRRGMGYVLEEKGPA